jgi:cation-transporting ATPase 13A3/4/5
VPGDVIAVTTDEPVLACDAVLLTGDIVVNESMLTGESIPVCKVPIESDEFDGMEVTQIVKKKRHVMYAGTRVIRARGVPGENRPPTAVVLRTGELFFLFYFVPQSWLTRELCDGQGSTRQRDR